MRPLETVVGLEVHARLMTESKMFCACRNDVFRMPPNAAVCPICTGHPGSLPSPNQEAVRKAAIAALALQCRIRHQCYFDRKNYFYPDLPSGFQISQYTTPLSYGGALMFPFDGVDRVCRITRLHVENDAGKLIHRMGQTLCDFNRAGTPLIEIVTEPDLRSPGEARAFAEELRRLLVAVGASSADMYKGMMRFDASISIRYKGEERLTPRAEIKNLNSFDALFLALSYEERRLREEWVKQGPPRSQITVGWEAETGKTEVLREKEEAADYRYFPEPDIPPLELSEQLLEELRRNLSILPQQVRKKYKNVGLSESETAMLIDQPYYQPVFDFVLERTGDISRAKSLVLTQLAGFINADDDRGCPGSARMCELLGGLLDLTEWGRIHRNQEKEILAAMVRTNRTADQVVYEEGVRRAETSEVERCIQTAIRENPRAIEDYRKGKEKALSAVVGWVMKETRGRADPRRVRDMLVEELQIETKRTK